MLYNKTQILKILDIIQRILGGVSIAIVAILLIMTWSVLLLIHPAYPILLGVIFSIGIILLIRLKKSQKIEKLTMIWNILWSIALVLLLSMAIFLRPFPANTVGATSTTSTENVKVIENWNQWKLLPFGKTNNVGIVFFPGMLVDSRAYLPLLIPAVQEGSVVIVPKTPLGITVNGKKNIRTSY